MTLQWVPGVTMCKHPYPCDMLLTTRLTEIAFKGVLHVDKTLGHVLATPVILNYLFLCTM